MEAVTFLSKNNTINIICVVAPIFSVGGQGPTPLGYFCWRKFGLVPFYTTQLANHLRLVTGLLIVDHLKPVLKSVKSAVLLY